MTLHISGKVNGTGNALITNTAAILSVAADPDVTNNIVTTSTPITPLAKLGLTMEVLRDSKENA